MRPSQVIFVLQIVLNISFCTSVINSDLTQVLLLTANFFSNLDTIRFSDDEQTRTLIDNQIDHYVELVQQTHGFLNSKHRKRDTDDFADVLSNDYIGVYVLNGFVAQTRVPVQFPKDIILFSHDYGNEEVWYAAVLQSTGTTSEHLNYLFIYSYEDNEYTELLHVLTSDDVKINLYTVFDRTYIIISQTFDTGVYLFTADETLQKIQTLYVSHVSDVALWESNNNIFMVIVQEIGETNNAITCNINSPVYKLSENYFNIVQYIDTNCAQKAVPLQIGNVQYVIVVNYKNDYGETDIFSEIYKFDPTSERLEPHQKIFTHAAVDVKLFCFKQNNLQEVFLVVANSFELDYNGNIKNEANSIIYKFVEDYFMPFQSFQLSNPNLWLPVVGKNGEFVLLVSCRNEGVKAFQYDGWRFIESEVQYTGEAFGRGVQSMRSYLYNNFPLIVIANENDYGDMLNAFVPIFNYQNVIDNFQQDMYSWCQQYLKDINSTDLEQLNELVNSAPTINDSEIYLNGTTTFKNVTIKNLVFNDNKISTEKSPNFEALKHKINKRFDQLNNLMQQIDNNDTIILKGDVHVKNLNIVNSSRTSLNTLQTTSINNVLIDKFLNEVIFLDDPTTNFDNIEFENIVIESPISPKFINGIPFNNFMLKSKGISADTDLIVEGTVQVTNLTVEGLVDGLIINENKILLTEGNQTLDGTINVLSLQADNLQTDSINQISLIPGTLGSTPRNIRSLTVRNVTVGYINDVDMNSVMKSTLRTRGDQEISTDYEFGTLIVDGFHVSGLLSNTKVPESLILTTTGPNFVNQDLIFTEVLETKNLHVIKRLNHIQVHNGRMDVLLKNYPEKQLISGYKIFDTLNVLSSIELRCRINSKDFDDMSPVIMKNLTLTGNYTITKNTIIKNLLKFNDLTEPKRIYSMNRLIEYGLRLNDTEIPLHINYKQDLKVKEIIVDSINGVNTSSWVSLNDPQVIVGRKIFNNVFLNGSVCISSINGYNLKELYDNSLKIHGDQIITGKHHYKNITAVRVVSNNTYVDDILWENVLTLDGDQHINGTTFISKTLTAKKFEAESLHITGKILGVYNFSDMISDTAFIDTPNIVTGTKFFQNELIFENLNASTINDVKVATFLFELEQWLIGDVAILGPIKIDAIVPIEQVFFNELNGIKAEDFGNVWLLKEGNQTVFGEQYFQNVECKNGIRTESNRISNVDLQEIHEMAVKLNEEHSFNTVQFLNGLESKKPITVTGKLNDINLDNIVLMNGTEDQPVFNHISILNNMTVLGYLHVNGLLSGINLTEIEHFVNPSLNTNQSKLIIEGNVIFTKGCDAHFVNEYDLNKIAKTAWFTNEETYYEGFASFGNVIFEDEVIVDGYVDDVKLEWLSKNYFSKTKNQTIIAKLHFMNSVKFEQNLIAEQGFITGLISGTNLTKLDTETLQNKEQTFDFEMRFDQIEITESIEPKLINCLDLSTDVMRHDVLKNIVTGPKTVRNLNAVNLQIPNGKKLQNVDVNYWLQNAVLLNGTFSVQGLTSFKNVKFEKNVELQGLLNSYIFDEEHILTKNTKQNITGKKTFLPSNNLTNASLVINDLELKGLLNDVNMQDLIQNKVDKTKNVTIFSRKNFYNTLNASNVNVEQLYQNVNVSQLISNITDLQKTKTYAEEYQELLKFSRKLQSGLKNQAYYIKSFKMAHKFKGNIQYIVSLHLAEEPVLAFLKLKNEICIISLHKWNRITEEMILINDLVIKEKRTIVFMSPLIFKNKWYIYLEVTDKSVMDAGSLYELTDGSEMDVNYVLTTGVQSVTSFNLPTKNISCLLTVHKTGKYVNVNCEADENVLQLHQQLEILEAFKSSTMVVNKTLYAFITSKSAVEIWKYNNDHARFNKHQIFPMANSRSIDSIQFKTNYFVVIGLRKAVDEDFTGLVIILKFDIHKDAFEDWQQIPVMDPTEVKFSIYSTQELILHIISECPAEPLLIYLYEGICGFKRVVNFVSIPIATSINTFSIYNKNFIRVSNTEETRIIKAVYTGNKLN